MRSLADRVRRTIRTHALVDRDGRVVVAVSGGADSVALLLLLTRLAAAGGLTLAGVAHFNHRLRASAARDEEFCRALASRLGLPIDVESEDVAARAADARLSIEVAAREARYAFLRRAAARADADRIAVGHTRDDQAETFLLRLLRGAGPRGLAAIRPRAGPVIRPLLDTSRDELRAFLAAEGQPFCEDETNEDLANPRNRLRHDVLPYLARHFAPDVAAVLAREAAIARDDADWLETQAIETGRAIVLLEGDALEIDRRGLLALHPAVARRVVRQALMQAAPGRFVGFDHVEALLELARTGRASQGLDLPGQRAEITSGRIALRPADRIVAPTGGADLPDAPVELPVPGRIELPALGWALVADRGGAGGVQPSGDSAALDPGAVVTLDAETLAGPLTVRTRRPGDWLRPLGLGGRKKLQDLFVDRKVPRAERDRVPLVVDGQGRIAWVVGHAVAGDFRVTEASRAVIILKASRLGGQG